MKKLPQRVLGHEQNPIPHFRAYAHRLTVSGERYFEVQVGVSRKQPSLKVLMGRGDIITEAEIRAWSARLPFSLNDEDVVKLAKALNLMRVTIHAKGAAPFHKEAAMQRAIKHIEGLTRELPVLIEDGRKYGSTGAVHTLKAFDNLLFAARLAKRWLIIRAANWSRTISSRRYSAPWHEDAVYLSWILKSAAARSGKLVSFTKATAPAVAFIDAALKRAGVSHGSQDAIARAMARYQNKERNRVAQKQRETAGRV